MTVEKLNTYKVQSEQDKDKWYQVVLEPKGFWIKGECDCSYYQHLRMHCEHIKRAITCFKHGL